MKRDQYWRKRKKAKVEHGAKAAWWYANSGDIELHVEPELDCAHVVVRLSRAVLKQYLAKSTI